MGLEAMAGVEVQADEASEAVVRSPALSDSERERVGLIEGLANEGDRSRYLERQRAIARQLKMSVRNVQRLVQGWHSEGLAGVVRAVRSDVGEHRLSAEWERYIVETYRKGNRGGRRMSRAQVAVRVSNFTLIDLDPTLFDRVCWDGSACDVRVGGL
ncbi:MAG: hypothetical protein HC895_03270 [Leptolyngbyaceae cyanobacterium SM1_3_5]|nr:hypothetical protein [Leptolyngbyaceae cyanobacterium SM1_3_5]